MHRRQDYSTLDVDFRYAKAVDANLQPHEHFLRRVIAPKFLDELVLHNAIDDYQKEVL